MAQTIKPSGESLKPPSAKPSEDVLALGVALLIFVISLVGVFGVEPFGWAVKTNVWLNPSKIFAAASPHYLNWPVWVSILLTYLFLAMLLSAGAWLRGTPVRQFIPAFTVAFFIALSCYALGHFGYIASTPDQLKKLGILWSLNLTGEPGFIVALLAGRLVGNLLPRLAEFMRERSE